MEELERSLKIQTKSIIIIVVILLASFIQILMLSLGDVRILNFRCDARVIGSKRYQADVYEEVNFIFDIEDYGEKYVVMGDGITLFNITGSAFSYSYDVEGVYNVTLWALGFNGYDSDWLILEVQNDAPDFDIGYTSVEYHNATYDFENDNIEETPNEWTVYNNDGGFYLDDETNLYPGISLEGGIENLTTEDHSVWKIQSEWTGGSYRYIDLYLHFDQYSFHQLTPGKYKLYLSANESLILFGYNPELGENEVLFVGNYSNGQIITIPYTSSLELFASYYIVDNPEANIIEIDWIKLEKADKGVNLIYDEYNHGKIVSMNFGDNSAHCGIYQDISSRLHGTIEFWYRTSNTIYGGRLDTNLQDLGIIQKDNTWLIGTTDICDPFVGNPVPRPLNNTWHHVRIDWNNDLPLYQDLGLGDYRIYIDNNASIDFIIIESTGINNFDFRTNGEINIDAIGYNWDLDYEIGGNIDTVYPEHLYEDIEIRFSAVNLDESEIDQEGFSYNLEEDVNANFSYIWDFGDGNYSYDESPSHTFLNEGEYPVRLTLIDDQGAMSTKVKNFVIKNRAPEASIKHGLNLDASYNFKFDVSNEPPNDWYTHGNVKVIDYKDEFSKVVEIDTLSGGYGMIRIPEHEIGYNGSIEFWIYFEDVDNDEFFFWIDKQDFDEENVFTLRKSTRFGFLNGKWMCYYTYKGPSNEDKYAYKEISELEIPNNNEWTHIQFDYCWSDQITYRGLSNKQWRLYVNEIASGVYDGVGDHFNRKGFDFKAGSHIYLDSLGFTVDPDYRLGDNNPPRVETYYGTWDFRYYPNGPIPYDNIIQSTVLGPWIFGSNNFERIANNCSANVISELDGHNKVLELNDNNNSDLVFASLLDLAESTYGTLEFWLRTDDTSQGLAMAFGHEVFYTGIWVGNDGRWWYKSDSDYYEISDVPVMQNNTWHHIRLDFDCRENGGYLGLEQNQFHFWVDGNFSNSGPFEFNDPVSNFAWNIWSTLQEGYDYSIFLDAVSVSWDPAYEIGDNTEPREAITSDTEIIFSADSFDTSDDQNNLRYIWNFGDNQSAIGQTVLHKFTRSGKYKIKLLTVDDNGQFDISETYIWIDNVYPTIDIIDINYGYATYDFTYDSEGEFPNGWYMSILEEIYGNNTIIIDSIDIFDNVVQIGNGAGFGGIWTSDVSGIPYNQTEPGDLTLTSGTIEFWIYTNDTSEVDFYISLFEDTYLDGIFLEFQNGVWTHGGEQISFENLWALQNNSWTHFRIDFCSDNSNYLGLNNDTFILYADGYASEVFSFLHDKHLDISNLTCFGIFTFMENNETGIVYVDNFGFSSDSRYTIGDNKFDYVQYQFNEGETIVLECMSYDTITDYQQLVYIWGDLYTNIGDWEDFGWYFSYLFPDNDDGDELEGYPIIAFVGDPLYMWNLDSYYIEVNNVLPTLNIHSANAIANISLSIIYDGPESANFSISLSSGSINKTLFLAYFPENSQDSEIRFNTTSVSMDISEDWVIIVNQTARTGGEHLVELTFCYDNGYEIVEYKLFDGMQDIWTLDVNDMWINQIDSLSNIPITVEATISDPSDDIIDLSIDYNLEIKYEVDITTPIYNETFIIPHQPQDIECFLQISEEMGRKYASIRFKDKIPDDWRIDLLSGAFPVSHDFDFDLDLTDFDIFNYADDLLLSEGISVIGYVNSSHFIEAYYKELDPSGPVQYDKVEFNISTFYDFKNLAPSIEIHTPINVTEDQEVFYYAIVDDFNNDQVNVSIAFGINNGNGMIFHKAITYGNKYYGMNYTYTNDGKYLIYVNATDGIKEARAIKLIEVENLAPYAKIRAFKNQTYEDEYITLSADIYDTPSDFDSLRYYWDFGDGVYSAEESPSHAFYEAGNYQIRLCVKDNNGDQFWASYNLTVLERPPEIIGPFALQGYEGQSVTLNVEAYDSLNDYLLEYNWEIYEAKRIHNATYNFVEFDSGEIPNYTGFEYFSENFISYRVVDDVSTHYKVLELIDNNGLSSGYWKLRYGNSGTSSGTVEFWLRVSDLTSIDEKFEISLIESSSGTLPILISDNGTWLYKNFYTSEELVIGNLPNFQSNFWHHIRIDFECTTGNYSGLGEDQWRIIVDGTTSPELPLQFGSSPNDDVLFLDTIQIKSGISSKGSIFCDAIGYFGGSNTYHIGDNLNTITQSYDHLESINGKNPSVALDEGTYLVNLTVQNDLSKQAEIIVEILNTVPTLTVPSKRYYGGTSEIEIIAYALDSYIDSESLEFDWYLEGEKILNEFGTLSSSLKFNCESTETLRGTVTVRDQMDQFSTTEFFVDIHMDSNGDGFSNEFEVFNGLTSVDVDGDGVPNYYEDTQLETNMWKWDTDDDRLSDGYNSYIYTGELSIGTDPLDNDTDNDLLEDGFEWFGWQHTIYTHEGKKIVSYTSNPLVIDSDDDLVEDYDEYVYKTNPFEPDTDKDELTDYQEIYIYGSDPTNPDCDNDGLLDGIEFKIGTLYDNSDTDGDTILDGLEYYGWDFTSNPLLRDSDNDFLPDNEEQIQYTYNIGGRKNVENPVILKFEEKHINEAESAGISFLLAYGEHASNYSLNDFRITIYKRDSELILYNRWIRMYKSERYYSEVIDIKKRIERAGQSYYGDYVFRVSFISKNHAPLCLEEFSINVVRLLEPNIADYDSDGLLDGVETKLIVEGTEEVKYPDVVNLTTDTNDTIYDTYEIEISDIGYVSDADIYFTIESNTTLMGSGNVSVVVLQKELDIRIPDARIHTSNFSFSASGIFMENYHIKPDNTFPYDFEGKYIILIDIYDNSDMDVFILSNLTILTVGYRKATNEDTEAWITKPDTSDSDNDGWSDKYEIFDRSKPTNPLAADTDGDGIIDSKDMNPHYNLMIRVDLLKGHIDELPWWYWGQKTRPDLQMSVEFFKIITSSYAYRYYKGQSYVTPHSEANDDPYSGLDTLGVTYWRTAEFSKKIFIDVEDDRKSFTFFFALWDEGIGDPDHLWDTLRMQTSYTYDLEDKNEDGDYYDSGHKQGFQYHSKKDWLSFKITTLGIKRANTIAIYDNTSLFNGHYNDHYRMHVFELTITDIPILSPFTSGINMVLIPNKFFVKTQLNALMQNDTAFENSFLSQGNYLSLKREDLPDTASNNIENLFAITCTADQANDFLTLAIYGLIDESTGESGIINSYSSTNLDFYPVEMMNIHKDILTVIPQITTHGENDDPGTVPENFFQYCGNLIKQALEAIEGILSGDWEPAMKLWEKLKGAGIALLKAGLLIAGGPLAIIAFKAATFLEHYIVLGIIIGVVSKTLFELSLAYHILSWFSGGTVNVIYTGNRLVVSPLFEMGFELDSEWVDYFSMEMTTLSLYFESPDWRYEFIFKYINITTEFTKSPDVEWIDTLEKFVDVFNTIGETMDMAGTTFTAMGAAVAAAEASKGISLIGGVGVLIYKLVKFYMDMVAKIEEKGPHINLGLGIGFFISAFAAFLPHIITKIGTSLSSTASSPKALKDLLEPHEKTAGRIGKQLKLLEYENVLNFDNQTRLLISTIESLVGGTLSLVIGCATLTILDKTWVTVARFALGSLYVYFGVINFKEFFQ